MVKSTWPGVSMMFRVWSRHWQVVAALVMVGVHALADHELLALMLGPGCGPASLRASLGLLDSSGGMTGLARLEADELAAAPGVGPAR
ncbi:MAG: hypothetical protein KKH47_09545, partial [Proteobacteria bacterium]|nr:hypothetical protein [Pseudomonadota bacterium]